jgi:phosphoglycolate phosphatase-like HAD superfamily hydrolase
MRLILFDIDGTLIRSSGAGRATIAFAMEKVFGTSGSLESYPFSGKTDSQIITDLLGSAGIPAGEIENKIEAVYELMASKGQTLFVQDGIRACPGVPELLAALRSNSKVLLGLLTGNISQTAPLKLAAAGIDPAHFPVGAYGSDAKHRNDLPGIAWERAARITGHEFDGKQTVVVGDTPADITCAKESNSTSVAVATGHYSVGSLEEFQPDFLFENLRDTENVLEILLPQMPGET